VGDRARTLPAVVRELEALLRQYSRHRISGQTLLTWIDDGWTQQELGQVDDGPVLWLVPRVRTALLGLTEGRLDDQARAEVAALLREYRRRRDPDG
jgi:hypothetical protein